MRSDAPRRQESDVVLRDGSTVHLRPGRPDDASAMRAFLAGLSQESRWLRFFSASLDLDAAVRWATQVDGDRRHGLVALVGSEQRIVAHAGYEREPGRPERAEVALAVADTIQGHGVGTILLGQLAETAAGSGVTTFSAEVLTSNHQMIKVFRDTGFPVHLESQPGVLLVEFPTALTPAALEQFARREELAAVAALRGVLAPRSVAVVGASRDPASVGGQVFRNLLAAGFSGPVYPVNPRGAVVQSVLAYPSIGDVPGPVDLAVIAAPAPAVVEIVKACAAKGVRSVVVLTAGFAETGGDGAARQAELLAVCRRTGMRLVGPNCLGVVNTDPNVRLNATFGPVLPQPGRVGFLSQSGGLGLAVMKHANELGLGFSSFVSVGNRADISSNDALSYWEQDPATDVILLYLESFGNPRRFARVARRVSRTKPIVAVKSGRSPAGARASSSHTGAQLAASDVTVDALFRQAGVIRTDTLTELFDVAMLLTTQPLPRGRRVGILTNVGGPGTMCADACEGEGLEVPDLSEPLRSRLAALLPAEASVANPVDMLAAASADHYRRATGLLLASGEVDALMAIFIEPLATRPDEVAEALRAAAEAAGGHVPVLAVLMTGGGAPAGPQRGGTVIPHYAFPESAARALAKVAEYGTWLSWPEGRLPELPDTDREAAAAVLASALAEGVPRWLRPDEVARLLGCYGLPLADWRLASTPGEAGEAAAELGGTVALKAVAPTLVHKTEAGGVRVGLAGADRVARAAEDMAEAVAAAGHQVERFLVQRMVSGGVEMLVGVVHDPSFGPILACGAGGTAVELLKDLAVRITPITVEDADQMVRSLATFPLLDGYRGAPKADVTALEDVLLRVSAMVDAHPEIAELDCNPVLALPDGAMIVDARVQVRAARPPWPLAAREVLSALDGQPGG